MEGDKLVNVRRFYRGGLKLYTYLPSFTELNRVVVVGISSWKDYTLFTLTLMVIPNILLGLIYLLRLLETYYILFVSIGFSIILFMLSPKIFRRILLDGFKRDLEREFSIFVLLMSIYSRRFALERIFTVISEGYFSKIIPKSTSLIRFFLVRTYLSLSTLDNTILKNLDLVAYERMKSLLTDIIRIRGIGGSIYNYVSTVLHDYYRGLSERWSGLWRNITGYLEIIILIYGLLPALISSLVFVIGVQSALNLLITSLVLYPVISLFVMAIVDRMNVLDPFNTRYSFNKISLMLLTLTPISIYLFNSMFSIDFLLSSSIWLSIAILPNTLNNLKSMLDEIAIESSIISVTTQLEELMSGGFTVTQALKKLGLSGLHDTLKKELRRIMFYLDSGMDLDNLISLGDVKSLTLFKMALIETIKSGGGLNEFISLKELLKSFHYVSNLRKISFFIAVSTASIVVILGVFSLSVISSMIGSIEYNVFPNLNPAVFNLLSFLSKLFLFTGSIYTSLILSKVMFGSLKNTIALQIVLLVLTISFIFIL